VKTIMKINMKPGGRNTKFIQIPRMYRRPPKLKHGDWDWNEMC